MRVISFSLWKDDLTYTHGAIRCARQAQEMFPDFICLFYIHKETVPKYVVDNLNNMKNQLINYYNLMLLVHSY